MTNQSIRTYVTNTTGVIELNRPKALNSLNPEMVEAITLQLDRWWDDTAVHRVVVRSTSEKGFCAGGDVRYARQCIIDGHAGEQDQFFAEEYAMNDDIAKFPKPYVSLINGVVMGGGLGISIHGSHRIVTERAFASMPEMAIGFTPDVGVPFALQRLEGQVAPGSRAAKALATFLVTTGWRLQPADLIWSGVGTHYVPSEQLEECFEMIVAESLDEALDRYATEPPGTPELAQWIDDIEATFGFDTWAEIEAALNQHERQEFVEKVGELIAPANPASLVAAAELMAASWQCRDIREELDLEVVLGEHMRRDPNFLEGVRAVLVDKDRNAAFQPNSTEEVDAQAFRRILGR